MNTPRPLSDRERHVTMRGTRRSTAPLFGQLDALAATSKVFFAHRGAEFLVNGHPYRQQRYTLVGPRGGGNYVRVGLFAGLHGDEPAGPWAMADLARCLLKKPELAQGYELILYPLVNPTGYEDNTRWNRAGADLNREFWRGTVHPEVRLLESDLRTLGFDGLISLHADDTSDGVYGFATGATLAKEVLAPALDAAARHLPVNHGEIIDNFRAARGIIETGYDGMLIAPPAQRPRPFEIVLETPALAPLDDQAAAAKDAVLAMLQQYREMISYAANL